jgi:hypothetical protein
MNPKTHTTDGAAVASNEDVESALAEMEANDVTEASGADIGELVLDDSDLSAVEVVEGQEAAYEGQETKAADVAAPAATKPAKAKKAAGAAKTPRTPRELSTLDASHFVLTAEAPADLEANKATVIGSRPAQKKIAEKFDNLFQSIAAGKKPSIYVMGCFNVLADKGTVTQTDLVAALKATNSKKGSSYSEGTARSQAGQIMNLFATVGIATREKQTLTYVSDSPIAAKLKAIA